MECEHGQLARSCNICEYEREIKEKADFIGRLEEDLFNLKTQKDKEIAELKATIDGYHEREIHHLKEIALRLPDHNKLSRLTAALNDDERAEKLKGDDILHWNRSYILGRTEGINDHLAAMKEKDETIATLTEELRLSDLRGDSLDRVVGEGVQKELKLENEIAELKDQREHEISAKNKTINLLQTKLSRLAADLSDSMESSDLKTVEIEKLKKERNLWMMNHHACDKDNDELRADNDILESKLSRLTALINDDERAEKVAFIYGEEWELCCARDQAINDYRAMLKEEKP